MKKRVSQRFVRVKLQREDVLQVHGKKIASFCAGLKVEKVGKMSNF